MITKAKIVIFGGSGFLGSHVADKLSDQKNEVVIFDIVRSNHLRANQKMFEGNILDYKAVDEAIKGSQVVYNFAGYSDLDSASDNPIRTTELNLIGNLNIIESCLRNKVKQFVYASTIYVFSESGGFYRCSKQAAESYIEEYRRRHDLTYTILRYGSLYGPRADDRNSIYKFLKQAIGEGRIQIKGDGNEIREYIHVRDAAKISTRILQEEYYNKRFVITGHQAIPVSQMLQMIEEILKKKIKIEINADNNPDHYRITPYSFVPKIGEKFAPDMFTDMGQGLIECIAEMSEQGVFLK